MKTFPHEYTASVAGLPEGDLEIHSDRLPHVISAAPAEFDGPGDRWSPETLLTAAIADCYVLTFRGIARARALPWTHVQCEATATLDREQGVTRFTRVHLRVELSLLPGADRETAAAVLARAEKTCLIANSLTAARELEWHIVSAIAAEPVALMTIP